MRADTARCPWDSGRGNGKGEERSDRQRTAVRLPLRRFPPYSQNAGLNEAQVPVIPLWGLILRSRVGVARHEQERKVNKSGVSMGKSVPPVSSGLNKGIRLSEGRQTQPGSQGRGDQPRWATTPLQAGPTRTRWTTDPHAMSTARLRSCFGKRLPIPGSRVIACVPCRTRRL